MPAKILLLDASTEALSVVLSTHLDNAFFEECPQQHSQKMLPEIERQLKQANTSLKEVDAIAYGKGPGSFTGVRVGVSVTQGLAFAANLPVIGVSTLQIMAEQCFAQNDVQDVFVAIDARMGEIYFAHYTKNEHGDAVCVSDEVVIKPELLTLPNISAIGVGTGFETYRDVFASYTKLAFDDSIRLPNVKFIANFAELAYNSGNVVDAKLAQPSYVRDTVTWKKLPGKE